MSKEKTPEQQAAKRYPIQPFPWGSTTRFTARDMQEARQEAHARCLEDYVIPAEKRVAELEAENARLREVAQEAEDALTKCNIWAWRCHDIDVSSLMQLAAETDAKSAQAALTKLAEAGITPSDR